MYDEDFRSFSLDEASLTVGKYLALHKISEIELIEEIQKKIFETTGLTCSVGCAGTRYLAKICSNVNKPNGKFILPSEKSKVEDFLKDLPVRKLQGVGKVMERILFELFGIVKIFWRKKMKYFMYFSLHFL